MKSNPYQRSEASGVQATADVIVQMEWGALKYVPQGANGEVHAYISERNDPLRQGCVYIITRLNKGEDLRKVGMAIFSEKDKRPSVQATIARNGAVTITHGGSWPGEIRIPEMSAFKIAEGDIKNYTRLRDEIQNAAVRLLMQSYGPVAPHIYKLCLQNRQTEQKLAMAQEQLAHIRKTGIVPSGAANEHTRKILKEGVSGTATARFGGTVNVDVTPAANAPGPKPKP